MTETERFEAMLSGAPLTGRLYDPDELPTRTWNPLRGLTLARVVNLLEQAEQGYFADLTWLYRFVEKREFILSTLVERRQAALGSCRWAVVAEEETAAKKAENAGLLAEQTAFLNERFGAIDNLNAAWRWLGMATFRGFAHLEMHVKNRVVTHLEPVPQWFFGLGHPRAEWCYNEDAQNTNRGTPIEEAFWVIRETEMPIDEIGSLLYVGKTMSWKDWQLYVSRHGVPNIFLECAPEAAAAAADFRSLAAMLEKYVSGGKGVLPPGVKANLFGAGTSSQNTPFPGFMEYADRALVLRGTGGKLTMLSDSTGIGQGATPAHEAAFNELANAEAGEIAELLHEAIGTPALNLAFPGQPHLARFSITRPKSTDLAATATALATLRGAGWIVSREKASEMLGFDVAPDLTAPRFGEQTPLPGATAPTGEAVEATALNGAQVTSLQAIIQSVSDGLLPAIAAKEMIRTAFPTVPFEQVERMVNSASQFTPKPQAANRAQNREATDDGEDYAETIRDAAIEDTKQALLETIRALKAAEKDPEALTKLQAKLPDLLAKANKETKLDDAFSRLLEEAFAEGVEIGDKETE